MFLVVEPGASGGGAINNDTPAGEMAIHLSTSKTFKFEVDRRYEGDKETKTIMTLPKGYGIAKVILEIQKFPKGDVAVPVA